MSFVDYVFCVAISFLALASGFGIGYFIARREKVFVYYEIKKKEKKEDVT